MTKDPRKVVKETCTMCGRYKRPGKQKIAEAFAVSEGLEAFDLEPDDNACPQSFQPVIHLNENGERQMELMRWAFRLPDKLLFNAVPKE